MVSSQIALHAVHGGVVPELAARAHLEGLATVVDAALAPVPGGWDAIDAMAVTRGPGLAGCLIVGTMYATSAALARGLPIVGVSHLAGHVYSAWLADTELEPPYLALLVSGGHTECVVLREHGVAERLAATRDDAAGEAFDKVARLLGLEYPGGPAIQRVAPSGDPTRFPLPAYPPRRRLLLQRPQDRRALSRARPRSGSADGCGRSVRPAGGCRPRGELSGRRGGPARGRPCCGSRSHRRPRRSRSSAGSPPTARSAKPSPRVSAGFTSWFRRSTSARTTPR